MNDKVAIIDQRPTTNDQRPAPLLSVVVTSYNEIEYLPQAIESILSQTFQDFEIIIGDDGSDDGSIELIKEYSEKYPSKIKYFVMDRPKDKKKIIPIFRVSNVLRNGIRQARGKYIAFLESDDYFCDDNKFSEAVKFLEAHNDYSCYGGGFKMVYSDGHEKIHKAPYAYHYPGWLFWGLGAWVSFCCCVFTSFAINEHNLLQRDCDDNGILFPAACYGKMKFTDTITFAYRQRDNSIMHATDKLELMIHEMIALQDFLCSGKMLFSTCNRMYYPFRFVYTHRKELHNDSYAGYFASCEKYDNNVLGAILNYDTDKKSRKYIIGLTLKMMFARLFFLPFRVIRKCIKILSRS